MAKKKKAPASNPARGFATTSLPSKTKPATPPPPEPVEAPPPPPVLQWEPPTAEEEAEQSLRGIVEKSGPKVRREAQRIIFKSETEKRTLRGSNTCYPLRLDHVFGIDSTKFSGKSEDVEETLGEKVIKLAREEYLTALEKNKRVGEATDGLLTQAWTLHKVLLGLGFKRKLVEDSIKVVLGREVRAEKDAELLLDEVLEWMALFCDPEELPGSQETPGSKAPAAKKGTPSTSGTATPTLRAEPSASADTRHLRQQQSLNSTPPPPPPPINPVALVSEISNLELETKDISDQGEDLVCSSEGSDTEEDEEEMTPETLIPAYLKLQTKLYKVHPSVASTITGGKKVKGGGKKPTKAPPGPPPAHLTDDKKKKVKKMQARLLELERDPLFDAYMADTEWRDARARLDEEEWSKKQAKPPRTRNPRPSNSRSKELEKSAAPVKDNADGGLLGGLFEGPPTEETEESGLNIKMRDFEEMPDNKASKLSFKGGKGKAGVGAAALRKLVQDICKSRDVNSKVRFDSVPGTSISHRCKLTISWTNPTELEPTPPIFSDEALPEVIVTIPKDTTTVFEMKGLAAFTKEQAEGYVVTWALFRLFGKKEEKLYLRLPTIWRNIWAELVEEDRNKSENEEYKVLDLLKQLLNVQPTESDTIQAAPIPKEPTGVRDSEPVLPHEPTTIPKASYQRYLEEDATREEWQHRRNSPAFQHMESYRQTLPMWSFRREILAAIEASPVIVLCGETGCGKSTQLPAFILENELENGRHCRIYCTEPRRISALSLAKRVSEEMGEGKGRVGGLVGYSIRLESMVGDQTRLVYATTGIVMRMLESTPELEQVTHLVLDEVHERSIESDFLLVVLRRLLVRRKNLKVILMSATVNAERFSEYLGGAPVLRVPGRTFPVSEYYLEDAVEATRFIAEDDARTSRNRKGDSDNDADLEGGDNVAGSLQQYRPETRATLNRMDHYKIPYDLILKLIETIATNPEYLDYSKAILVFLPGLAEIRRVNDMILGHPLFGNQGRRKAGDWLVYPLHSTIASEDQEAAFLVPPKGTRKIVLATNIAETGITIPDVTAVIDTGKHKEMRFDEKRQLSRLIETFVSKANAKQRRGRAGRVQPGICFHLFTRERYETAMAEHQTPEIMRLSLQDLVLRVKICGLGNVEEVLTSALDAPTPKNIRRAVDSLVEVKALTSNEELTALGRQLSKLPLDVYLGKLCLLGSLFSAVDATVTIAALLSSKSPFISPIGYTAEADAARHGFKRGSSDLLTAYNAYCSWRRICQSPTHIGEFAFCRKNYLSSQTLSNIEDLKAQLFVSLVDAGFLTLTPTERSNLNRARYSNYRRTLFFIPPSHSNRNSDNDAILDALTASSFYPKLLVRDGRGWRNITSSKSVRVHPSSVNKSPDDNVDWLSYYNLMQTRTGTFDAHETSRADPLAVILACGDTDWRIWPGVVAVDGGRIRFRVPTWRALVALKVVRERMTTAVDRSWRKQEREDIGGVWRRVWEEIVVKAAANGEVP